MISFRKLKKIVSREHEAEADKEAKESELPPPVVIPPSHATPHAKSESAVAQPLSDDRRPAIRAPSDTQEMDGNALHEQIDGLRRTLESGAFEEKMEKNQEEPPLAFGNNPPTIEMERPKLQD